MSKTIRVLSDQESEVLKKVYEILSLDKGVAIKANRVLDIIKEETTKARIDMVERASIHFIRSGVFELGFNDSQRIVGKEDMKSQLQAELKESGCDRS